MGASCDEVTSEPKASGEGDRGAISPGTLAGGSRRATVSPKGETWAFPPIDVSRIVPERRRGHIRHAASFENKPKTRCVSDTKLVSDTQRVLNRATRRVARSEPARLKAERASVPSNRGLPAKPATLPRPRDQGRAAARPQGARRVSAAGGAH